MRPDRRRRRSRPPATPRSCHGHGGAAFTNADKRRILQAADLCTKPGEVGALMRREGVYSSSGLVALLGSRAALLPELDGSAAYRVAPGLSLAGLEVPDAMATCIARLRRQTCNLTDIAGWTGVGKERAMRLLNALYLQSGLIVSRGHPAATAEGWRGYRG